MADGTVKIDLLFPANKQKFHSDTELVNDLLKKLGDGTGQHMDDEFDKNTKKMADQSKSTSKQIKDDFKNPVKQKIDGDNKDLDSKVKSSKSKLKGIPKETKTKLLAEAKKAGIDNFGKLLKHLPKKQQTELLAKAQKGEVIDFDDLIKKVPKKYQTEMKLNDNASPGLRNIQEEAQNTGNKFSHLKEIISGSFLGNALAGAFSAATSGLQSLASEAMTASDAMQGFQATMELAGKSSATIKSVGKDVKKYADTTVYDLKDVSSTTAQLAANGVKGYEKLTEAAGNLTAVAGGTKEDFKSITMVMTQTAGAGKLTTENWNQLTDAIPGASGKLQEAMKKNGAYTGDFRDAMADGQISAEEFNKAIEELGMTDKAKEYAKGTAAFEGAFGNLKSEVVNGVQAMIDAIGKSNITGAINGLAGGASKAFGLVVSSVKPIKEAFKDFGKAFKDNVVTPMDDMEVANIFDDMGKGFSSVGKALKPVAKAVSNFFGMFAGATVRVWSSLFDGIIKGFTDTGDSADKTKKKMNFKGIAGTINKISDAVNEWFYNLSAVYEPLGKIIGIIAKSAFDTFADIISGVAKQFGELADKAKSGKGPLGTIAKVLTNLSKHEKGLSLVGKAIGYIGTSIFALKGAGKVLSGVSSAVGALTRLPKSIGKLGGEIAYKLNVKTKPARKVISTFATYAKKAGGGIKKALTWSAKVTAKAAKKTVRGLGKAFRTAGSGVKKALRFTAHVATSAAKKAMRGLVTVAKTTGRGIRLAFNFLKANPFVLIVSAIAAVIAILVELYKHNKKFRKFVNGIVKSAKAIFSGVTKWFGKMYRGAVKHVKNLWNGTKKHFSNGWKNVKSLTSKGVSAVKNHFNDMKKRATGYASSMWNTANKDFRNGAKVNQNVTKTMKDVVNGHWGRLKGDLSRTGASIKKTAQDHFSGMYNSLNKLTGGGLGRLTHAFSGFGKGVKNVFSDIKRSIQKHVKNGINGAIGFINGGIGGINKVIHTFGGSKHAIGKIKKLATGGSGYRGIAQVNDGNGEEAILKGGQAYKVTGKNAYVNLEGDETVVPHEASRSMFGESIAHYAGGSKNWFSNLTGWFKDKWDGIVNFIKHPLKSLENIMSKAMGAISGSELVTNLAPALGKGLVRGIESPFKKMLQKLKDKHDEDEGGVDIKGTATPAQAKKVIKHAMKIAGVSGSNWLNGLSTIAKYESGFRNVTNHTDSNAAKGTPSSGWFQMIKPTFKAHAKAGYGSWTKPLDQAISVIGYIKSKYGGIGNVPGLVSLAHGGGYKPYANGGFANQPSIFGEKGLEAAVPLSAEKADQGYAMLGKSAAYMAQRDSLTISNGQTNGRLDKVEQGLLQAVLLLNQINTTSKNNVKATYATAFDKQLLYKKMAADQSVASYQGGV